jgi:hypothetical protein
MIVLDDLINAGYSEPGAIPIATPVPMYDNNATGMYEHETKMVISSEPVMAAPSTSSTMIQQQRQHQQTFVLDDPTLSRGPMMMRRCPNCQQESRTRVTTAPAWQTWAASVSKIPFGKTPTHPYT